MSPKSPLLPESISLRIPLLRKHMQSHNCNYLYSSPLSLADFYIGDEAMEKAGYATKVM